MSENPQRISTNTPLWPLSLPYIGSSEEKSSCLFAGAGWFFITYPGEIYNRNLLESFRIKYPGGMNIFCGPFEETGFLEQIRKAFVELQMKQKK